MMDERIGPYRILRKLGEGGMGVVYAAEDERLRRTVAIKTIRDTGDETARERFFREARAAASLSHPNVCQLFDIGDDGGRLFLVMELLEGEPLSDRLKRGAMPLGDAVNTTLSILTALDALHTRGFVHRDLKPSNVFLTAQGVKLLDFGLARETHPLTISPTDTTMRPGTATPLTLSGMIVGTPRYMAPEQLTSAPADARTDLFGVGVLLFEMISGRPPFDDDSAMKLFHAIVYEAPPNLAGSAAITAINRIVHRAMAKKPEERYQSAAAMGNDLREILLISDAGTPVLAHRVTRLIVLPLRLLRPDPEIEFLAQALPEAITTSLAGVGSLVLRSPMTAARIDHGDLKRLAQEADVDVVLTGTLLRSGEQIRVNTQLVEVPAGTVIWSQSLQATMSDIFALQDTLTQRIVEQLELPLSDREARLVRRDVPASSRAHEFYLRAGQQGETPEGWQIARDLYQRALDEDPRYAPAWARIARIYLLLGKYVSDTEKHYELGESAVRHALELNPDLPLAHLAYAQIEVATGRAHASMLRLLDRVQRGTSDPAVFAGLVMALRYCGLLEASAAAHEQARQLDPHVSTSAAHTFWMLGRPEQALLAVNRDRDFGDEAFILESMGRIDEALATFDDRRRRFMMSGGRADSRALDFLDGFEAVIRGDAERALLKLAAHNDFPDPEGMYFMTRCMAHLGRIEQAVELFEKAIARGFFCTPMFLRDPWLDPIRSQPRFVSALREAEQKTNEALRAFSTHPGSRVLAVGLRG